MARRPAPVRYPGQGRRPKSKAAAETLSRDQRSAAYARVHERAWKSTSVAGRR